MPKRLLKIAGVIEIVYASALCLISLLFYGVGVGVIGSVIFASTLITAAIGGVFLYFASREDEELGKIKRYILVTSIFALITGHVIGAILGIITLGDICSMPNDKYKSSDTNKKNKLTDEERAQRRLKYLLALGCGLVLLSGVIFAMTTWNDLSGIGKTVSLAIATIVFFAMSSLSERKFKLKASSVTYYVLSNAFLIVTFISTGYFNMFGSWFSLNGSGRELYIAFLWTLGLALSYMAYAKYHKQNIFYGINFTLIMIFVSILRFINLGRDFNLFVITFLFAIFALVPFKSNILKKMNSLSYIGLFVTSLVLISNVFIMTRNDRIIFYLLTFGVEFIATYCLAIFRKSKFYEVTAPIVNIITSFLIVAIIETSEKIMFLQFLLLILVFYTVGYLLRNRKVLFTSSMVICDLAGIYVLLDSVNLKYSYYAIIMGALLVAISIIASFQKDFGKYYFEKIIEPIKVILLSYAIFSLTYSFSYTENGLLLALLGSVFAIVCIFKSNFVGKVYFMGSLLFAIYTIVLNSSLFAPISQTINILTFGILLCASSKFEDKYLRKCQNISYGLLLLSLATAFINISSHFELKVIGVVLLSIIYTVLFFTLRKNKFFRAFTVVALLIPYVTILPISIWNDNVNYILYSLPWLALIFIYTREFLGSIELKKVNIIEVIALLIWFLGVVSRISLEVAIFMATISFIAILIGYKTDKWSSLYYTGIVFLIANTLIQLKEFWTSIPVWAYILVIGLVLIGVVTYREYSGIKSSNTEKMKVEIVEQPKSFSQVQLLNYEEIVTGSIVYLVIIPILIRIIF